MMVVFVNYLGLYPDKEKLRNLLLLHDEAGN